MARPSDSELNGMLASVVNGSDPDVARDLICYFHKQFQSGESHNSRILIQLVQHAFKKIIENGWTADHAFGLKLKRGHYPRPDTTERDIRATAYVLLLRRKKWTKQDAIGEAANLLFPDGAGDRAVASAYKNYADELSWMSDEVLKSLLPAEAQVISRDMNA